MYGVDWRPHHGYYVKSIRLYLIANTPPLHSISWTKQFRIGFKGHFKQWVNAIRTILTNSHPPIATDCDFDKKVYKRFVP